MGARDRWFARAISRTLLLLLVALVAVLSGAVPGGQAGAASENPPPGDPPGNNGTVKIERDSADSPGKNNEPHVDGCMLWLEYYGFDEGQTADITFTAQPPSGPTDKVLLADKAVKVSDTPAGGGQDRDYVIGYNLTSAVQGLQAHPKQGYHIKLSSDTQGAPGGAKQKVFWINCQPAAPTTLRIIEVVEGNGTGPFRFEVVCSHRPLDTTFELSGGDFKDVANVPPGTTCAVRETPPQGGQIKAEEKPATGPPNDGVVTLTAGTPVNIIFTNVFPGEGGKPAPPDAELVGGASAAANDGTAVLGAVATAPEAAAELPRTGGGPGPLTATGLWCLGAGGLVLLAGRRLRRA
jgi:hypothetical protein